MAEVHRQFPEEKNTVSAGKNVASVGQQVADLLVDFTNKTFSTRELVHELQKYEGVNAKNAHLTHFFNNMTVARNMPIAESLSVYGLYAYTGKRRMYNEARDFVNLKPVPIIRSSHMNDWDEKNPFQVIYDEEGGIIAVDYNWQKAGSERSDWVPLDVTTDAIEVRQTRRSEANKINSQEIRYVLDKIADAKVSRGH